MRSCHRVVFFAIILVLIADCSIAATLRPFVRSRYSVRWQEGFFNRTTTTAKAQVPPATDSIDELPIATSTAPATAGAEPLQQVTAEMVTTDAVVTSTPAPVHKSYTISAEYDYYDNK